MDLPALEKALVSGTTLEEVAAEMTWQKFEDLCASVLEENGFSVRRRHRFSDGKRRYEIDVLATKRLVKKHGLGARRTDAGMAIDCKHWACGKTSALLAAAKAQAERTKALRRTKGFYGKPVTPAVVTLFQENAVLENGVWIIPVFKLNAFLASGMAQT